MAANTRPCRAPPPWHALPPSSASPTPSPASSAAGPGRVSGPASSRRSPTTHYPGIAILRRLESWICRAYRRAWRLLGVQGMGLARRLGFLSALRGPSWLLPDPDLSELVLPQAPRRHAPRPRARVAGPAQGLSALLPAPAPHRRRPPLHPALPRPTMSGASKPHRDLRRSRGRRALASGLVTLPGFRRPSAPGRRADHRTEPALRAGAGRRGHRRAAGRCCSG